MHREKATMSIFISHTGHKYANISMTNVEISSLTVVVPWRETPPVEIHNKAKVNLMTKFMCTL